MRAFPQMLYADAGIRRTHNDLTCCGYASRMTDDDMDRLDAERAWLGPTLRQEFDLLKALPRMPDCAICPSAQWYVLEAPPAKTAISASPPDHALQLECFCTAFRAIMFNPGARIVTLCDARMDAIDEAQRTTTQP